MNFFKRLFGGGGKRITDRHYYVYVKPKACQEVVRVGIDMMNDLSLNDEGNGYIVRKQGRGTRCPFPVEIALYFDANRALINQEIERGEWATLADYQAFLGQKQDN